MKYIIDTDPGIDDAIAIMIAYLSKLDIIGFTLTEGNIELKHSENNLKIIEDLLESDIKIYKSENPKLSTFNFAFHAHGKNGLGDVITDQSPRQTEKMSAEEFIINSSKKYEDNLTIVCFGPLTNLANAIKKDPEITKRITRVVIMGTSYNPKAKEPYHEFNLKVDPVSAEIVLNSKLKDILIITHETGIKTYIEKEYIESLEYSENKISRFLNKIAKTYMDFSYQSPINYGFMVESEGVDEEKAQKNRKYMYALPNDFKHVNDKEIGSKAIDSKYDIDFYGTNKNYFDFAKANEDQKKEIVVAFADEINSNIEEFLKNLENK